MSEWPAPPDVLIDACAERRCVLFTGSAMCPYAGLPNRLQLMSRLLQELDGISDSERLTLRGMLDQSMSGSGLDDVGEVLTARFEKQVLFDNVRKIYSAQEPTYGQALNDLPEIGFESAFTNNWDAVLEHTFRDKKPIVLTGSRSDLILDAQKTDAFIIAKLFGDLKDSETFRFTTEDYRLGLYENQALAKIVTTHIESKSVFFLGVSLQGMQNFFFGLPWRLKGKFKHFALVLRSTITNAHVEKFRARYNIELLPFEADAFNEPLERFVSELRAAVHRRRTQKLGVVVSREPNKSPLSLDRVVLKNIGAIAYAEFPLSSSWTVLLGNNGLGKSTVLRAIALGLCGDDRSAAAVADQILRVGTTIGSIRLHVGDSVYETYLKVEGNQLRVETYGVTPVQRGDWVVLGFPSLRGIGSAKADPSALLPSSGASTPVVSDLLPLLSGAPDLRLQNLRTWIAYCDRVGGTRVVQQREAFFKILQDLMPGSMIELAKIEGMQVFVKTIHGIVPIDQLSQGMMSLFGWIGTTLQRMYEIYPDSPRPELEPGLVLVDEIDAHLHPEWQQSIVPLVKKHFPKLQVVATTHSPLVASSLNSDEVFVVERDGDHCTIQRPPTSFKGLRADQVLTGPMFGLRTTRSEDIHELIHEYSILIGVTEPSLRQKSRLLELEQDLSPLLNTGETPLERQLDSAIASAAEAVKVANQFDGVPSVELHLLTQQRLREIIPDSTAG